MNLPRTRNGVPTFDSVNSKPAANCCCGGTGCYDCSNPGNLLVDFSGLTNPPSGADSGSGLTVWDGVMIPYVTGYPQCSWFVDAVELDLNGTKLAGTESYTSIQPTYDFSSNPIWILQIYVYGSASDYIWWIGTKSRDTECPDPGGTYTKAPDYAASTASEEWYNYIHGLPGTQRNPGPASLLVSEI